MLKTSRRAAAVMAVLVLVAGCGGSKRKPAVTTDPARPVPQAARPMPDPTPFPEQPVDAGPDVQPMTDESARAEDFSVSDASRSRSSDFSHALRIITSSVSVATASTARKASASFRKTRLLTSVGAAGRLGTLRL